MVALKNPAVVNTIIGVLIFLSIPLLFVAAQSTISDAVKLFFSHQYWVFTLFYCSIYFLLSWLVMPKLYSKRKFVECVIVMLFLLVAAFWIKPFDGLIHHAEKADRVIGFNNLPPAMPHEFDSQAPGPHVRPERRGPVFDFVSIFLLVMVFFIILVNEAVKKSRLTEQRAIQAEADKANAELSFLKAQINPHFLFNTLNNIYSLSVTKSDHAPDAIMKLSNIMRYLTDGANETMVPLQDEIDCINDYISLQKLRLGEGFPVDFSITGNTAGKIIPPLVLMTFVENAFKHGVSNHEKSDIVFKIVVQEKYTHFFAQNVLFESHRNAERTGVGIENTKKRLQVLYAEKHLLMITQEGKLYTVELVLYN